MKRSGWCLFAAWATLLPLAGGCGTPEEQPETPEVTWQEWDRQKVPSTIDLLYDWSLPVPRSRHGKILRGWVMRNLLLLETEGVKAERHHLIAIHWPSGEWRWRCELGAPLRYEPELTSYFCYVNVDNHLLAIERVRGVIRWEKAPAFTMSTAPVVLESVEYPEQLSPDGEALDKIYVGAWNNRLVCLEVRGKMREYWRKSEKEPGWAAPDYTLRYLRNVNTGGHILRKPVRYENAIYFGCEDKNVYAVGIDEERTVTYQTQGKVSGPVTVSPSSVFCGAEDNFLYCLDRLTLVKKWRFAAGAPVSGKCYVDEKDLAHRYVFVPVDGKGIHCLSFRPSRDQQGRPTGEETFEEKWFVKDARAVVGCGKDVVYLGVPESWSNVIDDPDHPEAGLITRVIAVDKFSGKQLWDLKLEVFRFCLENYGDYDPQAPSRLFFVTEDNHIVSLIEEPGVPVARRLRRLAAQTKELPETQ